MSMSGSKIREQVAHFLVDIHILSPLVPWSIACAVVLDATGAPAASVPFAWYLYLLPLWNLCLMRKE